jgi:hypothetical protein
MSSSDPDPAELERRGQREADKLEARTNELGQEVDDVSQDWQQKRADEGIPGAKAPTESDESEDESDEEGAGEDEASDSDEHEDSDEGDDSDSDSDSDKDED